MKRALVTLQHKAPNRKLEPSDTDVSAVLPDGWTFNIFLLFFNSLAQYVNVTFVFKALFVTF